MSRPPFAALAVFLLTGVVAGQGLGTPFAPFENPVTAEKAILGKVLFWDEQLSSSNAMACGTCHQPAHGGADDRAAIHPGPDGAFGSPDDSLGSPGVVRADSAGRFSHSSVFGLDEQVTRRIAPSVIGAAYFSTLRWDGLATETFVDPGTGQLKIMFGGALEHHAAGPPTNPVEMSDEGVTWNAIAARLGTVRPLALATDLPTDVATALAGDPDYGELMRRAFGDRAITSERIIYAIATYQRTLVPDQSPWDRYQAGDPTALRPNELAGLQLFEGTAGCATCHPAPLFSDGSFRNLGLRPVNEDRGWQIATGDPIDRGKFKVPTLRNIGLRSRFMHHGAFTSLGAVVDLYAAGGGTFPDNRDPALLPFSLTPTERSQLVAFLRNALTDPRVAAELPPFDRPTLAYERHAGRFGADHPGSGGIAPQALDDAPLLVGGPYRLGVADALGGSIAAFVLSTAQAPAGTALGPVPIHLSLTAPHAILPFALAGSGPGNGFATLLFDIPNDPNLAGLPLLNQIFVVDPAASGGLAATSGGGGTVFRRP
jgi:cytochrome c peroxidase